MRGRREAIRCALALFALAIPFAHSDKARAVENAQELLSACQELDKDREGSGKDILIPSSKDALVCWGYMQAMQDLSVLVDQSGRRVTGSCPPEETTSLQLIDAFLTYARSHAGELKGNAAAIVIKAFQERFPCRPGAAPPRRK